MNMARLSDPSQAQILEEDGGIHEYEDTEGVIGTVEENEKDTAKLF